MNLYGKPCLKNRPNYLIKSKNRVKRSALHPMAEDTIPRAKVFSRLSIITSYQVTSRIIAIYIIPLLKRFATKQFLVRLISDEINFNFKIAHEKNSLCI